MRQLPLSMVIALCVLLSGMLYDAPRPPSPDGGVDVGHGVRMFVVPHATTSLGAPCPLESTVLVPADATRSVLYAHGLHGTRDFIGNASLGDNDEFDLARWVRLAAASGAVLSYVSTPGIGRVAGTCPRADAHETSQPYNDVVAFVHRLRPSIMHSTLLVHSCAALYMTRVAHEHLDARVSEVIFVSPAVPYVASADGGTVDEHLTGTLAGALRAWSAFAPTLSELRGAALVAGESSLVVHGVVWIVLDAVARGEVSFSDRASMYEVAAAYARGDLVSALDHPGWPEADWSALVDRAVSTDEHRLCALVRGRRIRVVGGIFDETIAWRETAAMRDTLAKVCGRDDAQLVLFDGQGKGGVDPHRAGVEHALVGGGDEVSRADAEARTSSFDSAVAAARTAQFHRLDEMRGACPGRAWSVPCADELLRRRAE